MTADISFLFLWFSRSQLASLGKSHCPVSTLKCRPSGQVNSCACPLAQMKCIEQDDGCGCGPSDGHLKTGSSGSSGGGSPGFAVQSVKLGNVHRPETGSK